MPLPFGNPEPHALKQTFLKDVTIIVRYISDVEDLSSADLNRFAKERFGLEIFKDWQGQEEIVMSADHLIKFSFLKDEIKIRLRYPHYKKFDDILKFLPYTDEFLSLRKAKSITEIAIVKYNEINYTLPNESLTARNAMNDLFSEGLMKDADIFDMPDSDFNNLTRWEKKVFFNEENLDVEVDIVYGFSVNPEDSNRGTLILKPSVTRKFIDLNLDNLTPELKSLNRVVFQAFHWSIKQEIFSRLLE